ncbi:putative DD41D transposase [Trichonephila clavipes]|nr:putative DD41D transposase [Trichonephila clavipes]
MIKQSIDLSNGPKTRLPLFPIFISNRRNCRIWSEANPQVYVETPLHPEKLTVCCALWAGGIIGPYFFKNDEGHNVTVNGDRYRAMITNFFIPELNNHDVQELWFQQDGATCHTARATIDLLKDTFGDRLISRFGPVNRPPRSCDLTPLDYFLWGYVKSLVYADKPQTLENLEDNIRRVIADIRPQMLEKVIESWTSRLYYIRASRGSPMPEIIFKIEPSDGDAIIKGSGLKVKYPNFKEMLQLINNCTWLERPAANSTENTTISPLEVVSTWSTWSLWNGILPGTKWCGVGDIAGSFEELGTQMEVDACCRAHDHCPVKLKAFRTGYGIINLSLYTKNFIQRKSAAKAHRILVETYGDNALSETAGRDWFQRFKNNDFELKDIERSGTSKKV